MAILLTAVLAMWVGRITVPSSRAREKNVSAPASSALEPGTHGRVTDASPGASASRDWDERWSALGRQPPSPARDVDRAAALVELARVDPARALALAEKETHRWRRLELRRAALQGWAASAPDAAADWVLRQPAGEREDSLAAVFAGAAIYPDQAVALGQRLCVRDPMLARERGLAVIAGLVAHGAFTHAAAFATRTEFPGVRDGWMETAFARWGESDPLAATQAALNLPDAAARAPAVRAAVQGWAQTEPEKLAEFAIALPAGDERTYALSESLRQWIEVDTVAAAGWLDQLDASPDLDSAVAAIATRPFLAEKRPEVALSWAESISEPRLRTDTLASIVREWAVRDRVAALRYVHASVDISPDERADLLNGLGSP